MYQLWLALAFKMRFNKMSLQEHMNHLQHPIEHIHTYSSYSIYTFHYISIYTQVYFSIYIIFIYIFFIFHIYIFQSWRSWKRQKVDHMVVYMREHYSWLPESLFFHFPPSPLFVLYFFRIVIVIVYICLLILFCIKSIQIISDSHLHLIYPLCQTLGLELINLLMKECSSYEYRIQGHSHKTEYTNTLLKNRNIIW